MKKYLVLYRSTVSSVEQMANATPEEAKAGMDAWMSWGQHAGSGVVDLGSPVAHPRHFSSPTSQTAGDQRVGGFSILQAENNDALAALLNRHPHFMAPGASIDVFEFLPLPGM